MKSIENFRSYYNTELQPILKELEEERIGSMRKTGIGATVILGIAAILAAFILNASLSPVALLIPLVIGAALVGGAWWLFTKDFKQHFKNSLIRQVIQYVDPSLAYTPAGKISRYEFESSTLFKHRIDRYRGEDLVDGQIDKTKIRFSELHAEYKTTSTDSKGRRKTHWHTIFKGLFFIADFNKHFHGRTVVLPDSAEKLFGRLGKKLQEWNLSRDDLINMEDVDFEKEFVVYGTDQIEARYILSTALMRRILEFKRKMKVPVHMAFVNSDLYMAISIKKNMFEPRLLRKILDFEIVRDYLEDVILAVGIVEDLNLNTRIWTKE